MILREAQIRAFEQDSFERFAQEMAVHCQEFSPRLCKTLRTEELHAAVRQGLVRAEAHGLTQRGPSRLYIDLMIVLGGGFDSDPLYGWAQQILSSGDQTDQMERAEALHAKVGEHLLHVDGANNSYTVTALHSLQRLCDQELDFEEEELEPQLLRLIEDVYPRKVAESGRAAVTRLIAEARLKAQECYQFQTARSVGLMAFLAFAFGHDFDSDPFLPWIARTLSRTDDGNPDSAAARLENRARTWLDAVVRNFDEGN